MFETFRFALKLVSDAIQKRGLSTLFQQQVFYQRVAIPGYFDLTQLEISNNPLSEENYQFVELNPQDIRAEKFTFLASHRQLAALRHFKQGLRGFALVNPQNIVIGDVWCLTPGKTKKPIQHPDLAMLNIACAENDCYALDIFLPPSHRGKNLAVSIHRSLEWTLKQEGCRRLYAYYWEDNIPSKWMHWMLKFTELPKVRISRFFFIRGIHTASNKGSPHIRLLFG